MNKSFIGKKLLSLLLSVLMCLSLIPSVAFATTAEGETEGSTIAENYTVDENGNVAIYTEDGLFWFAEQVNSGEAFSGKTVTLENNIALTKAWTPIGYRKKDGFTGEKPFKGIFNGNNHVISGFELTDNSPYNDGIGFFGKAYVATIKNLTVEGNITAVGDYVGGIVGHGYATIENCVFKGNISGDAMQVGGIAGSGGFTITNCSVYGNIHANTWAGGIVGNCQDGGAYTGCYVEGEISSDKTYWGGGAAGITPVPLHPTQVISGCYSNTVVKVAGEEVNCPIIATYNNPLNYNGYTGDIKIYDNSWNKQKNSNDSYPLYAEENGVGGVLMEGKDVARDNNLVMIEDDLNYITGNLKDVRIMNGSKITREQIEGKAVAEVNGAKYATLKETVTAAKTGDTVTLLADISLDEQIAISEGITIDGQGRYTIKAEKRLADTSNKAGMFYRTQSAKGTLTFLNVTLDGNGVSKIFLNEGGAGETVFDGVTSINGSGISYGAGIHISGGGSHATIKNSSLTGSKGTMELNDTNYYAANDLWVGGNVYVTVENSTIGTVFVNTTGAPITSVHGNLTVKGTETKISYLSGDTDVADKNGNLGSFITIKDGNFETIFDKGIYAISGGVFINEVKPEWCADGFIPTKNADGTYGVKSGKYVAEVNGVKYETLQAAIDAAGRRQTVTLVSDTKENVTIAKQLTLDLNGYTLNGGTVKGKPALTVTARVTVKDSGTARTGTIMREDTAENSGVSSHYVIDVQGAGWLTFEGGNVKNDSGNSKGKGASLVRIGDDSVAKYPGLNIKGGTFTQDNFIAIKVDRGDLFLNGGTINSANSYAIENWFRATVKGGTVNGDAASWTYSGGANSELIITGGTINGNVTSVNYGNAEDKKATVKITGGTVNGELDTRSYDPTTGELTAIDDAKKAAIEVTGGTFTNDPTAYLVESSSITKENGKYSVAKAYLAKVGNTQYYTMDEAFKAQTASGEEIVLLRDYKTAGTFSSGSIKRTVDLNGHTWTYTGTGINDAAFEINYSDATLTVKNGKVISNTLVGLIPSAMGGTITYDNSTLIFENVEMISNGNSGIETNGNNTNDTVTLKNSTLNVPNGFGIYFPSSGALNIENSKITAKTMGVQVCAGSLNISGSSEITVTGDPVAKTENDGAIQDGAAISIVNRPGYKGLANVTITGGTFKSAKGEALKAYTWENKTESKFDKSNVISVSGGTFSNEIPRDYCAAGLASSKNSDGTYTVKDITYVAEVGGVKYETVNAAIAAANNGDTVTLLSDTTEDVLINKSITLDLGGKTLTNTGVGKATISITVNNVTVKNGNVIGGASYYNIEVKKGASATLEGVTATAGNTGSSMVDNWGTLTIKSGSYTGGLNTVKSEEGSTLTITGGKFVSDYAPKYNITGTILVYGDTIITGGEFIQNSTSTAARVVVTGIVEGYTAKTVITGGNFTTKSSGAIFHGLGKATWDNFEVSGGTFNKSISAGFCADGYIPTKNTDGTYGVKKGKYVAAVGSKNYETLADAIRLAAKGKTVKLLEDIEVNSTLSIAKNLIIDLNGKTLTGKTGSYMFNIADTASVTFENGTINVADNYGAMNVYGQLSLQNVNIEGAAIERPLLLINGNANVTVDKDTTVYANANVKNCYPAILFEDSEEYHNPILKVYGTIKAIMMPAIQGNGADKGTTDIYIYDGAKVLSNKLAMYLPQLCNVNITGGLVEGYCGIGIKSGTLNISGGEVRGIANDDVIGDEYSQTNGISYDGSAILIDSYVGYAGQVKINISGDAVIKSLYSTAIREIGNDASQTNVVAIAISGGQILGADGKQAVLVRETSVSTVSISGGTFSSAVPADYCAAGYAPKANTDGTYGVEPKVTTEKRNLSVEINGYGTVDYSIIGGVSGTWDNSITNVPYEIGTQFTLKAIPGDGFTFLYWVNSEGRVLTDNLTYNFYLGDNLTIKAVFCKTENSNAYVIFRDRGNTILKATSADSEGYIDVPTNLIDYAGYTFIGWYDADGKEYIVTDGKIQVSGNVAITIYAKYKADTETVYTVTVDGIEKGKYTYGSYVTVTAEDIEGKEFAGWYINGTLVSYDKAYSFYVTGNVALEARYSDTVVVKEPVITLLVSERKDMADGKQSVILTASWSADSSYTFVGAGIILSQNADTALTLENVDGRNVVKTDTRLTSNEGTYAYTLTLGTTAKLKNVYAVAYFTFIKDGKVVTIYTAVQTA